MKALKIGVLALISSISPNSVADEFQFSPSQDSLAEAFRQIGESLQHHRSPLPYLDHIRGETSLISRRYEGERNSPLEISDSEYLSDEYLESIRVFWERNAENLTLDELAREVGKRIQQAIDGDEGKGTSLVLLLNRHQAKVLKEMESTQGWTTSGRELREELLCFGKGGEVDFLASRENKLSSEEQELFASLLRRQRFTKSDFEVLESFYEDSHDKLSNYGKALLSERLWAGSRGEDVAPSEGSQLAAAIEEEFASLFDAFAQQLPPEVAEQFETAVKGIVIAVVSAAQRELELSIKERALSDITD